MHEEGWSLRGASLGRLTRTPDCRRAGMQVLWYSGLVAFILLAACFVGGHARALRRRDALQPLTVLGAMEALTPGMVIPLVGIGVATFRCGWEPPLAVSQPLGALQVSSSLETRAGLPLEGDQGGDGAGNTSCDSRGTLAVPKVSDEQGCRAQSESLDFVWE